MMLCSGGYKLLLRSLPEGSCQFSIAELRRTQPEQCWFITGDHPLPVLSLMANWETRQQWEILSSERQELQTHT